MSDNRTLAIFGHPPHGLLIYQILSELKPAIAVMTDGSGGAGQSQTEYARKTLVAAGALPTSVFGLASDKRIYRAIMDTDVTFFAGIVEQLCETAAKLKAECVLTDPIEYFNPVHDLTNAIADIVIASFPAKSRPIKLTFELETRDRFDDLPEFWNIKLSRTQFERKMSALRNFEAIATDRNRWETEGRLKWLETERIFIDRNNAGIYPKPDVTPHYEEYGRHMVANGRYPRLITYAHDLAPLIKRLHTAVLQLP